MEWDKYEGIKSFFGKLPVDMNSPPRVGEKVRLTSDGFEFEVEITHVTAPELRGIVRRIGPQPLLEAIGIKRGESVSFQPIHIETLYRA